MHKEREGARNIDEINKRLQNKQIEFDSLQKDFYQMQKQMRSLMSSEGNLMTEKEKLEAQKKMSGDEAKQLHDVMEKQAENWTTEKRDLQLKIQDLLLHNDKVKDDCLKKVVAYKEKYQEYKQKVKQANGQIGTLMQRIARYEMEHG